MRDTLGTDGLWEELTALSDVYTCYSAAVAAWVACEREDWQAVVNPGLWLTITERADGLLGFAHFPPDLRARLGLVRTGNDGGDGEAAVRGVVEEARRSGRVIVAGDGYHLPWHVAFGRRHVPHWFVVVDAPGGLTVLDPFACRNELGVQEAYRAALSESELEPLLTALPGDDPVLALRESLALGDEAAVPDGHRHQWFIRAGVPGGRAPSGAQGPDAVHRLASHFRSHGQDAGAYAQADDIWSIARHRAFLCRRVSIVAHARANEALEAWVEEHAAPLAKRWAHLAPLLMQATLALAAGRSPSASVPETLDRLAEQERIASETLGERSITI